MRHSGARKFIAAGAVLLLSLTSACSSSSKSSSSGGSGLEKTTMTVASLPLVDGAALYIAQKEGFFKAEGLTVKIEPVAQSILALPALEKGSIDAIAGANYVTFLQAADKGTLKLSILAEGATLKSNLMDVLAMPKSGIKTPKDLEGKKIGVNILNNIQSLTLNEILKADNVDPAKVTYVAIPFPQMASALQKGQVDAIHVVEPFLTNAQEQLGAKVIVDGGSAPVTDLPISGYVATSQFAQKYPHTAAAFQRAIFKAQQAATSDRKLVEEVIPSYAHVDAKVASIITLPGYPTTNNATRMQRIVNLMTSAGLLKNKLDIKSILLNPTS